MSAARIITVGVAYLGGAEDAAGREVARAVLAEGLPVAWRAVVDEDEAALEALLRDAADVRLTVVLARAGGSAGDIVRRVLARLSGARLVLSERLLGLIEADFARRGQAMPRRHDRLALLPQGAQLWPSPAGEPGWAMETAQGLTAVLPLGSAHLPYLIDAHVRPAARDGSGVCARTLKTVGVSAADCEERLGAWLGKEGDVHVACLPVEGEIWIRLIGRGRSRGVAAAAAADVEAAVRRALGDDCYGGDEDTLEGAVGRLLADRGLRVSVAESCTGGLLASRLSRDPGASSFFDRSVVAYSHRATVDLLGASETLLAAHGAVSEPVIRAMASAIRGGSPAACGLAVTGICGPDGGSADKPVGTVYVAAASPVATDVRRLRLSGGREAIRSQACQAALDLLRRALLA